MMIVGLTGGIGSGKSTVAKIFELLRIPVFYADDEAKLILDQPEVQKKLVDHLGDHLLVNQKIDRKALADEIFNNNQSLAFVNQLVHPAVAEKFKTFGLNQVAPYVLQEAAILFETGGYKKFNATILVTAPVEVRINRLKMRDQSTEEQIVARMKNQWDDEKKLQLADYHIINDGTQLILPQIMRIHENLIRISNSAS